MIRLAVDPAQTPETVRRAEMCVVGSMLRDNDCIADVLPIVRLEDLTSAPIRDVFKAIVALWDTGKPADAALVGEHLQREGKFDTPETGLLLHDLWEAAPTSANAVYYGRIVRERSVLRSLSFAGAHIQSIADKPTQATESVLEEAERTIFAIGELGIDGQTYELRDLVYEALDQFDSIASGRRTAGVPSGFVDLDELTTGFHPGELVIVGARPSVGKTALGIAIANNVRKAGTAVLFASLEQSRQELAMRLLCMEARVNSHRVRSGHIGMEDSERLQEAVPKLRSGGLHIDDTPRQSMFRIASTARRLKRKHGIGLIVVDYLQLLEPENRREPRHEQVGQCTRKLKALAKELNIPVLALAQLNRASEERPNMRPRLSDLRESGSIEADADTVMLLHRQDDAPGVIDIIVGKQRNGPTGDVTLAYRKEFMLFEDFATGTPYDTNIAY